MRVLHCTDTYPPQVNGVSVVTKLAVDGLLARGVDVGLVTPRYEAGPSRVFGASHAPDSCMVLPSVPFPPYPDIRLAWPDAGTVERFARRFRPDLVHADTEFLVGHVGARVARRLGVPLVTSFHTDFARYTTAYGVPWMRGPVTRALRRFHAGAVRTFTPSSVTARWLADHGLSDVEVWGRAVDTTVFHPGHRGDAWRQRLGLGTATVFLHVGRLAAEKNIGLLLRGFGRARRVLGDRVRLVIAGDGPAAPALRRGAPDGTVFVGFIDRSRDLPALYAMADAFLCASTTETLGLVILEAMASGLPVAAVAAGGVAEHLRHLHNGIACDANASSFSAAVRHLTEDAALRKRLGTAARQTAVSLGWDRELDRLVQSYAEVLDRTDRGRGLERDAAA